MENCQRLHSKSKVRVECLSKLLKAYTRLESVQRNKLDLFSIFTDDLTMRTSVSLSEIFTYVHYLNVS